MNADLAWHIRSIRFELSRPIVQLSPISLLERSAIITGHPECNFMLWSITVSHNTIIRRIAVWKVMGEWVLWLRTCHGWGRGQVGLPLLRVLLIGLVSFCDAGAYSSCCIIITYKYPGVSIMHERSVCDDAVPCSFYGRHGISRTSSFLVGALAGPTWSCRFSHAIKRPCIFLWYRGLCWLDFHPGYLSSGTFTSSRPTAFVTSAALW